MILNRKRENKEGQEKNMNRFKLNSREVKWVLYDVGNSAFTLLIATILPIYFNALADNASIASDRYMAYWGYAASIATLIVALLGPFMGTLADTRGYKKKLFVVSLAIGAGGCIALGFAKQWLVFLVVFVIAKVGYSVSLIFYDSMLVDVTEEDRMDQVSSKGYAWGYIGSCVPFVLALVVVLGADKIGITMSAAMMIAFFITTLWWVVMTLPLLKEYQQKYYVEKKEHAFLESFKRLGNTFVNIRKEKAAFLFLLAFFFYIDGVYTIIDMATAYGAALGLDSTGLLLALLLTQIVAFPSALLFGYLSRKVGTDKLITVCIFSYFCVAVYAMFLTTQVQFWVLAVWVGMFQGGIQALSRSYFTKIIPPKQAGEFFGFFDICGKGAAFMGTTVVSTVTLLTGKENLGVGVLALLFLIGMILFRITVKEVEKNKS